MSSEREKAPSSGCLVRLCECVLSERRAWLCWRRDCGCVRGKKTGRFAARFTTIDSTHTGAALCALRARQFKAPRRAIPKLLGRSGILDFLCFSFLSHFRRSFRLFHLRPASPRPIAVVAPQISRSSRKALLICRHVEYPNAAIVNCGRKRKIMTMMTALCVRCDEKTLAA